MCFGGFFEVMVKKKEEGSRWKSSENRQITGHLYLAALPTLMGRRRAAGAVGPTGQRVARLRPMNRVYDGSKKERSIISLRRSCKKGIVERRDF